MMDKERIDGFRKAFAPGEVLFWQISKLQKERRLFYENKFTELFRDQITAIFAVSDYYALDMMRFLQEMGVNIPDDIQIIGFDDTMASRESTRYCHV